MIYIFEDNSNADISKLFRVGYTEDIHKKFVYAQGNGNITKYVMQNIYKEDFIIVYMDMIPGNLDCVTIYKDLRTLSYENNFKIIVIPIVCAEYYMLKSLKDKMYLFKDENEVRRCIDKVPHISSKIAKDDRYKNYCKNFEKYCKILLKFETTKECIKPFNIKESKNGQYYREDCICEINSELCTNDSLISKCYKLWLEYKYIPFRGIIDKEKNVNIEGSWEAHRELVEQYNNFVSEYRKLDTNNLSKYKFIKPIK